MPTGYTADVVDGKVTAFSAFALSCARAFGALIDMRDEPFDAPIPNKMEPHVSYYDTAITTSENRLKELQSMSGDEASVAAKAAYDKAVAYRAKYLTDKEAEAARLNAMLEKVRAWKPPTQDHEGMKTFMIEQLTISMPGDYAPAIPVLLDGSAWRATEFEQAAVDLARNKTERAKEMSRTESRNEWLKSLRASLAVA